MRTLKELGRSYLTITQDVTRVMSRIKALYRSWAIPCSGTIVYAPRHRAELCVSLAVMCTGMASGTQGDQVLLGIVARVATQFLVMNLQIRAAPTALASPAIAS